jgi:ABC-type transport system involved in Fe-S cluster assembly fused permease/ATPase subunit
MTLLIAAKFVALASPIIMKMAVDSLTQDPPTLPWYLVVAYGLFRFGDTLFSALRDMCFASVSANIERVASLEVFVHLNRLSLDFHLKRKTGAVIRSVSRGASSFTMVLRVVLFQLFPVLIQVLVVCTYLFLRYPWWFAVLTFSIMVAYFAYTMITTDWRNQFRREMNQKDNEFNQKAVDALLNFETVKYFNAEEHETTRYDRALTEYRQASIVSQNTLAILNCGQDFIISSGVAFGKCPRFFFLIADLFCSHVSCWRIAGERK